jgi:hypothetical protein
MEIALLDPCDVYNIHQLFTILALALTWLCNKDYGLGDVMPDLPKNSRVAIPPYTAVNRPSNGSEVTDPVLGLILTAVAYAQHLGAPLCTQTHTEAMEIALSQLVQEEFALHRQWDVLRRTHDFDLLLRDLSADMTHPDQINV